MEGKEKIKVIEAVIKYLKGDYTGRTLARKIGVAYVDLCQNTEINHYLFCGGLEYKEK